MLDNGPVPQADTGNSYIISFWMNNVRNDLYPRTRVTVREKNPEGKVMNTLVYPVSKQFIMMDGNRALTEYAFKLLDASDNIEISIQNTALRKKRLMVDNLLLRPDKTDVFYRKGNELWKNNRRYPTDEPVVGALSFQN